MKRKSLINQNDIGYILVIVLLTIIMFFQKCDKPSHVVPVPRIDTIVNYVEIHDTVIIKKTKLIKSEPDTLWKDSVLYMPDTSYPRLLKQYKDIGNRFYTTHMYKTVFPIGNYGSVSVVDVVKANQLISSQLVSNLVIPEKTVTIIKQSPPTRQIYLGLGAYGSKRNFVDGVYVGGIYKDKQDRLSGASVGYSNGQLNVGVSSYWKIKF